MPKTVIIMHGIEKLQYFLADADLSHLNEVCIGSGEDQEKEDELDAALYSQDGDLFSIDAISLEEIVKPICEGAIVIECAEV